MALVNRFSLIIFVLLITACSDLPEPAKAKEPVSNVIPDNFLSMLNPFNPLAAGQYKLILISSGPALSGELLIHFTSSSGNEVWQSQLVNYSETDNTNPAAKTYSFSLLEASGFTLDITAPDNSILQLMIGTQLLHFWPIVGGEPSFISFPSNSTNSLDYSLAYYAAVDPNNDRDTLDKWKALNGFDLGYQAHVLFRDARDLGYGRDMYGRKNVDGSIAIFVDNYKVTLAGDDSTGYGPININPAYEKNHDFLIGVNAIEFSPLVTMGDPSERVLKFFTFDPATGQRILMADLDGRGSKSVPSNCLICHGGVLLPLETDGTMNLSVLRSPNFNMLELDQFEYSDQPGFSRAEQETSFRQFNQWIYDSFNEVETRPTTNKGRWDTVFAVDLLKNRYGGNSTTLLDPAYDNSYIPPGWTQATNPTISGVENLYKTVVEPHCVNCHSLRGRSSAFGGIANAINFTSYSKFISFSERIIEYVYERGVMPASLRNYEKFWIDSGGAPTLLAGYLTDHLSIAPLDVKKPGTPIAKIGNFFIGTSPLQLDGNLSVLAESYSWKIISKPTGAVANLDTINTSRPILTGDWDINPYTIELTVSNAVGSDTLLFQVIIEDIATISNNLTFVDDIMPLMQGVLTCSICHSSSAGDGIPVYYDVSNTELYADIFARINLSQPERSLLIQKPTQDQHGGGAILLSNFNEYRTMLEWIRQGAPCGIDILICSSFQSKSN